MVLEDAIRDKTAMVEKEMADKERAAHDDLYPVEQHADHNDDKDSLDDDDFGNDEESERIMRTIKEQRLADLAADYEETQTNKTMGHGTYSEIVETEFLPTVTGAQYCVVAFFHKDFERCKIVDMHLHKICKQHTEAKFVRIDAEKSPFFI